MDQEKKVNITKGKAVRFSFEDGYSNEDAPLYAVNYFDTHSDFLYKIYTYLAGYKALKLGARVLFKGSYSETLLGGEEHSRKWLLIVRYPKLSTFISLLTNRYFQMISILRIKAVRKFTFGFVSKKGGPKYIRGKASRGSKKARNYAIHHFKFEEGEKIDWNNDLKSFNEQSDIQLFFAGQKAVTLSFKQGDKPEIKNTMLMDGLIIWQALTPQKLKDQLNSENYKILCSKFYSNYIGILNREL